MEVLGGYLKSVVVETFRFDVGHSENISDELQLSSCCATSRKVADWVLDVIAFFFSIHLL
jgi:hypothetical protein